MRAKLQSTALLYFVIQNQLPVAIWQDLRTRIAVHADFALLIANLIGHIITEHFSDLSYTVLQRCCVVV